MDSSVSNISKVETIPSDENSEVRIEQIRDTFLIRYWASLASMQSIAMHLLDDTVLKVRQLEEYPTQECGHSGSRNILLRQCVQVLLLTRRQESVCRRLLQICMRLIMAPTIELQSCAS